MANPHGLSSWGLHCIGIYLTTSLGYSLSFWMRNSWNPCQLSSWGQDCFASHRGRGQGNNKMKFMRTRTARGPRNCCPRSSRTRTWGRGSHAWQLVTLLSGLDQIVGIIWSNQIAGIHIWSRPDSRDTVRMILGADWLLNIRFKPDENLL